jgi:subtilase family serine protease
LYGHVPAVVSQLQPVGNLSSSKRLHLAIGLPLRNQAMLVELLQRIYNQASPDYHHYLTSEQFTKMFGPTEQDYQKVITFAKTHCLTVTGTYPNHMLLDVDGSVVDIEKAFNVKMCVYQHPTEARTFYTPDVEPSLDLAVPILCISGLNNYSTPHPRFQASPITNVTNTTPNAGSGPAGTYIGNDFRAAYVPDSSLTGSGQVVGLLEFDGYNANDIAYYESQAGLPNITLANVLLDGFNGRPTSNSGEIEVSLDIEMAISMAPGLPEVIVYEAGPSGNWHDILNRMTTDNLARQLSCSWYNPGQGADPIADQIFQQMAAQGQSFFDASGDRDAYTGLIDFPADNPYITQVGGTTLTTSGPGGAWVSETVWNDGDGNGTGGGISTSYPIPSWQKDINMMTNQGSTVMRNTPDVALTAYNVYVRAAGQDYEVIGTSCAAPLWAGFTALANQQALASGRPTIGFINTTIYAIGKGTNYASCFHDITEGNNTSLSSPNKFYAVAGYDLCTGWGTPAGQNLINALVGTSCGFTLAGDLNGDCIVNFDDFAILAENWLIDCYTDPNNPQCVPN